MPTHTARRTLLIAASLGLPAIRPAAAQTRITLKLGHQYATDHPVSQGADRAAALVTETSNGALRIEVFPAGQLGNGRELDQQVSDGALDMTIDGPGIIGNWHRPVSIFESPFLARDWAQLVAMMESPWAGQQFAILAQKQNILKIGRPWYYGARQLTTRDRQVRTVADARGLKLRVPEVPVYLDMIRAMGATPTPMALSEVYLSLQTGVVDGQENPLATIETMKFAEVQKVLNLTAHVVNPMMVLVHAPRWAKLREPERALVLGAFDTAGVAATDAMVALESRLRGTLEAKGMTVIEPDRESFRVAMRPVIEKHEASWGRGVHAELQKLG